MTSLPSRASLTAARRTSPRWERQPSSSSPRASAKALAASVGQMVRPAAPARRGSAMTVSTTGFESERHALLLRRARAGSASSRRHGHRSFVAMLAAMSIGRHFVSTISRVLLITANRSSISTCASRQVCFFLSAKLLMTAFVIELDRDQAGVVGDALQGVSVRAFVRQVDADDGKGGARRAKRRSGPQARSARIELLLLAVSLARPARERSGMSRSLSP